MRENSKSGVFRAGFMLLNPYQSTTELGRYPTSPSNIVISGVADQIETSRSRPFCRATRQATPRQQLRGLTLPSSLISHDSKLPVPCLKLPDLSASIRSRILGRFGLVTADSKCLID